MNTEEDTLASRINRAIDDSASLKTLLALYDELTQRLDDIADADGTSDKEKFGLLDLYQRLDYAIGRMRDFRAIQWPTSVHNTNPVHDDELQQLIDELASLVVHEPEPIPAARPARRHTPYELYEPRYDPATQAEFDQMTAIEY